MTTRNERVILTLQDDYTGPVARAAAATRLLSGELDRLDGSALNVDRSTTVVAQRDMPALGRSADRTGPQIDRMSGRLRILAEVGAAVGPAFIPIGGLAVAAVGGLANQLGVAVLAAGGAIIAFQGIGDALGAISKANLEPTAANLEKARQAMQQLSPAARDLTRQLISLQDEWKNLKAVAGNNLFPGISHGLKDLETRIPEVERIVRRINRMTGQLFAEGAESLAGPEWDDFFKFLRTDVVGTLNGIGKIVGNLARGAAELWMAFDPLNDFFTVGLLEGSRNFAAWADGLDQTQGFQEFVAYIKDNGPQVGHTLGEIAGTLIQITEAAAPLGGPTLKVLEAIAKVVSTIADSPFGTPLLAGLAALSAYNRVASVTGKLNESAWGKRVSNNIMGIATKALPAVTTAAERAALSEKKLDAVQRRRTAFAAGKGVAAIAGVSLAASGAADNLSIANTATLALTGAMVGGVPGAIAGGLVGAAMDLSAATDLSSDSLQRYVEAQLAAAGPSAEAQVAAIDAQIAALQRLDDANDLNKFKPGTFVPDRFRSSDEEQKIDALKQARAELTHQTELQVAADHYLASAEGQMALHAAQAKVQQDRLAKALAETRKAAHGEAEAIGSVGNALKSGKQSLNGFLKSLEHQIDALRNFRKNAVEAAERGVKQGLIHQLERLGPAGALQLKHLADASDKEIGRANADWVELHRQQVKYEEYKVHEKELRVNARQAKKEIGDVQAFLNNLHSRTIFVTVETSHKDKGNAVADGGTIPGQRQPYGDKAWYKLAPGEEVITNRHGQADRFRADRAAGRIPAYGGKLADGGTAALSRLLDRRTGQAAGRRSYATTNNYYGDDGTAWGVVERRLASLEQTLKELPPAVGAEVYSGSFDGNAKKARDSQGRRRT